MSLPPTNASTLPAERRKPLPTSGKTSFPATTANVSPNAPLASATSKDSLHFGHRRQERAESPSPEHHVDSYPEETDYTLPERLLAAGKNGMNKALVWNNGSKDCIKADFKKSLWITLLTLPLAFIIPGPQILIPPVWVGYKFIKRFYQAGKAGFNDPLLAEKRASKSQ